MMGSTTITEQNVEYWKEMFSIGIVAFNGSNKIGLKSVFKTVISTPLLNDIECLTVNVDWKNKSPPFTSWMLQGLLSIANSEKCSETNSLCVQAHTKIMLASFESKPYNFSKLCKSYIEMISDICEIDTFPTEKEYLLTDKVIIKDYNIVLTPSKCDFKHTSDIDNLLLIIVEVINNIQQVILDNYLISSEEFLNLLEQLLEINNFDLTILCLPMLKYVLKSSDSPTDLNLLESIQKRLVDILPHKKITDGIKLQELITEIWSLIQSSSDSSLKPSDEYVLNKFFYYLHNQQHMTEFLFKEIGFVLKKFINLNDVLNILDNFNIHSLVDKIKLLESCIHKDIETFLKLKNILNDTVHTHIHTEQQQNIYLISDYSSTWKYLWEQLKQIYVESTSSIDLNYLTSLLEIVNICSRIIGKLHLDCQLCKYNVKLLFFGDKYVDIVNNIIRKSLCESSLAHCDVIKVLANVLVKVLYLPECSLLSSEELSMVWKFVTVPWENTSVFNVSSVFFSDDDVITECLRCIRVLEQKLPSLLISRIYHQYCTNVKKNIRLGCVSVESVPYLYLTGKYTPSRLITDILHPALLSDEKQVIITLVNTLADFVCCLAGTGYLARKSNGEVTIECCECSESCDAAGTRGNVSLVEPHLLKFLTLLSYKDSGIVKKFLKILPRLTMHMTGLRNEEALNKFLQLMTHKDEEIRYGLAVNLTSILFGRSWVLRSTVERINRDDLQVDLDSLRICFEHIENCLHMCNKTNSQYLYIQNTLIETLTYLSCFPIHEVLKPSLLLLMNLIGNLHAPVSAILMKISSSHKTTPLLIYQLYKPELSNAMANLITVNYYRYNHSLRYTITEVISTFKGLGELRFTKGNGKFIVPVLLVWAVTYKELEVLLVQWAEYVKEALGSVLSVLFENIYIHIMLSQSRQVISKCEEYIEKHTNVKFNEHVTYNQKNIINLLLFNLHREEVKVLTCLGNLVCDGSQGRDKTRVADELESRYVGYLLFIVSKFVKDLSSEYLKIHSIKSLTSVIQLMGVKHTTPVARKVLATLQTTLNFNMKEYKLLHCQAWDSFVHNVDVAELGPLLATITSTLLPLYKLLPCEVGKIFHYLIVDNEKSFVKYLPNLFFIPDEPHISECFVVVQKYVNLPDESLKDRLNREISLSLHEAVTVRVEGLKALYKTLSNSPSDIYKLIVGSDEVDTSIISLVDALITCCSDSDQLISVCAARCLGQLGAVDPGLLPRKQKRLAYRDAPLSVHDSQFGYLAISEVARGFQNARNSIDMDAFALAIQELFKAYNVTPAADNEIWKRFPEQSKMLMVPLFTSLYKGQTPTRISWPDVIFGTKEAGTHVEWACLWASKLIGLGKDDKSTCIFRVCEPSFKRDSKILQFMLQYILLQTIMQDTSQHKNIQTEMDAVLNWTQETSTDDFSNNSRPIRSIEYCGYPNFKTNINVSEVKSCAMTVFMLLDFLHFWLRMYRSKQCVNTGEHLRRLEYVNVKSFLDKVDYLKIASSNCELGEYTRSIMYLEDVIQHGSSFTQHLPFLKKLYLLSGDLDSVAGATNMLTSAPNLEDTLLSHQAAGQLEEVRIVYERLGQDGAMLPDDIQSMARCYLNLGEPFTATKYIRSMIEQQPDLVSVLSECMADSLIRLGDYKQLDTFLTSRDVVRQTGWELSLGRIFLSLEQNKHQQFVNEIELCRVQVANSFRLSGLQFGDYEQGYPHAVRLQILNELEDFYQLLNTERNEDEVTELLKQHTSHWTNRSGLVQSNTVSLEPLLTVRRSLLDLAKTKLSQHQSLQQIISEEISQYWVKSAEAARQSGCFHQSYNYILSAERYKIPAVFIEKAQLYWEKGDQDLSLHTLSRGLAEFFPDISSDRGSSSDHELEKKMKCAEAKLLYAVYNEEVSNCDYNSNMANYQEAFDVCKQWEKTEVYLAQCLDRVVGHMVANDMEGVGSYELCICMVHHFGRSLKHGCEYIYQSVPRMLSVWLDMGEKVDKPEKLKAMNKINKLIVQSTEKLPPFILMTALPQLLSRLGHPNRDVFLILKSMLVVLLKAFPQQCLWAMQLVAKSSIPERIKRYTEVIQDNRLKSSPRVYKLIADFTTLCDKLNRLTNRSVPTDCSRGTPTISMYVSDLPQLFTLEKFSPIIIPITRFCSITLPRKHTSFSHDPFPKQAVYIEGIQDELTVLPSLQKPKKITFRGSDGKLYDILCKPKDDLRRDGRLMEFNNIVNMYLHRDPDSRARGLHIRTYVVTPLGENGGLIEWVPNLIGMRPVLLKLYRQIGKFTTNKTLKSIECNLRDSLETKRSVFLDKLMPLHPAVLQEWFRLTFPEPSDWYVARQSYIRTTAVMSMVGYILGLGDRHGENILLDSESGDTIHVDFNCLFNKGEKFDWKERVPFRLTHNMIAAMGPLGSEGTFRKSCEISLRVLRSQLKTLMSVLTPFAYDPFGSWGKNREIVQNERDQKIAEALGELNDIEKRLNGSLRVKQKNSAFYLSVEGQVRSLIADATDVDNLCQMYIGWSPFM